MAVTSTEQGLRKERGLRARKIREELLRLSRPEIQKRYGIPTQTQQGWEDAKYGGISERAAQRLLEIYKAEGLTIALEYLMYGEGDSPFKDNYWMPHITRANIELTDKEIIAQELKLFHKLNKQAVHFIINDDALAPWYVPGDYVAGCWHFDNEIEKTMHCPSIINTDSGETLVRIVHSGSDVGLYDLVCSNPNTSVTKPMMKNVRIISSAPIIWIRKPKTILSF